MNKIIKITALVLSIIMLMSAGVFANEVEADVPAEVSDALVVAYFNASVPITSYEFTNIDVLNYHPAQVTANGMSYTPGNVVTHNSSKLEFFKTKAYAQNPDIKFVFTVANQNLNDFHSWFYNPTNAKNLAKEMLAIIEEYDYDGLDIDYEFPNSDSNTQKRNYVNFMKYMREGFDELSQKTGKDYILSMAVPAGSWAFSLFNMNDLTNYVDYFNIMSYDLHVGTATKGITHHHTNPYDDPNFPGGSVESDIKLYREMGIPDDKIVVGLGMYARRWTGVANVNNGLYQTGTLDETTNEAYIHYSVLRASYEGRNGYVKYWDDVAKAPYLYNASKQVFLTYDDEQSAELKCKQAEEAGIRGVMVFDYCTTDGFGFFDDLQGWLDKYVHTHSYSPSVEKEASCKEEGIMRYSCECGDYYDEAIPKTEHSYGNWTVTLEPTYLDKGIKSQICSVCGAAITEEIAVLEYVNPFIDVKENAWFADYVAYCVKHGYINGMTENTFAPNGKLTRAQFLTLLAKLDGVDLTRYEGVNTGFNDVKPAQWFNEVVAWALENQLTSGLTETTFGPNKSITRSQLARFFKLYSEMKGMDVSAAADLSAFSDAGKVQAWAKDSVEWAVAVGLISGVSVDKLAPNDTATRAQAARILTSYDDIKRDEIFSKYPELLTFIGEFDSVANIHDTTLIDWAQTRCEKLGFTADEENMIYTHTYRASSMNGVIEKYFGVTLDLQKVAEEYSNTYVGYEYNEAEDSFAIIYYGGYGYGGPSPEYKGFEKIDDTHYKINCYDFDMGRYEYIIVEYRQGNYVILSKKIVSE